MKNILRINSKLFLLFVLLLGSITIKAQTGESGEDPFDFNGMNELHNVNVPGYSGGSDNSWDTPSLYWSTDWWNTTNNNTPTLYEYYINNGNKTNNSDSGLSGFGDNTIQRQWVSLIALTKNIKPGEKHTQTVKVLRGPHNSTDRFVSNLIVNGLQVGIITFSGPKKEANGVHIYTKLTIELFSNSPISISSLSPVTTENTQYDGSEHSKNDNLQNVSGNLSMYKDLGVVEFNLPMNENEDLIIKGTPYDPYNPPKIKDPCEVAKELTDLAKDQTYKKAINDIKTAAVDKLEHSITFGKNTAGQTTASAMTNGVSGSVMPNINWPGAKSVAHNHPNDTPPSGGDILAMTRINKQNNNFNTCYAMAGGEIYAIAVTDLAAAQVFSANYLVNNTSGKEYPKFMFDEMSDVWNDMDSYLTEGQAMAKAFVVNKYNGGITFFKQNSNGVFYPLITKEVKQPNGSKTYKLIPCI